jgi:hypothetical protein
MSSTYRKRKVAEIQVVSHKEGPLVCSFPNGLPASLLADNDAPSNAEPVKFLWKTLPSNSASVASTGTKNKQNVSHSAGRVLIGRDQACLYTSHATAADIQARRTQLAVGVYDRETGTLALHRTASQGHVYALAQSVPSYDDKAANINGRNLTGAEHRRALFEDFGSSKKRKVLRSQEANRVNVDAVVGAGSAMVNNFLKGDGMSESNRIAVEHVASQKNGNAEEKQTESAVDVATREWRKSFLPPFDGEASKPELVYDLKAMVGEDAWFYVTRVVNACLEKEEVAEAILEGKRAGPGDNAEEDANASWKAKQASDWNDSLKLLIHKHADKGDRMSRALKAAMLCNYWTTLYGKLSKRRFIPPSDEGRSRFFGVPIEIASRWLELFATSMTSEDGKPGYVVSKAHRDKCAVHVLILYVIADGNKTMKAENIKPLSDDLKMDIKDASHLLRQAGFTVNRKAGSGKTNVTLKVPLSFPASKRGGAPR